MHNCSLKVCCSVHFLQGEELKSEPVAAKPESGVAKFEPVAAAAHQSDLDDFIPKTKSSPSLSKLSSSEFKPLTKDNSSSSLLGPSLLPPPFSGGSKRRSRTAVSSQAPATLLVVVPPVFAGQTLLQPTVSPTMVTKTSSTSLNSQFDSSSEDKTATSTAGLSPSLQQAPILQPTLSPVLVPKLHVAGSGSPSLQGKAPEPSSDTSSFPNSPVSTPSASPSLNPKKTSGAVLSPLANVSIMSTGNQSTGGGTIIPIAVAIHETCNAIFRGSK